MRLLDGNSAVPVSPTRAVSFDSYVFAKQIGCEDREIDDAARLWGSGWVDALYHCKEGHIGGECELCGAQ